MIWLVVLAVSKDSWVRIPVLSFFGFWKISFTLLILFCYLHKNGPGTTSSGRMAERSKALRSGKSSHWLPFAVSKDSWVRIPVLSFFSFFVSSSFFFFWSRRGGIVLPWWWPSFRRGHQDGRHCTYPQMTDMFTTPMASWIEWPGIRTRL